MADGQFQRVCLRSDIPKSGTRNYVVDGQDIAIFDTPDGLVARSGVCKHNAFKLEMCDRHGDVIRCPLHGWEYRVSTGKGIKPSWTQLDCYPLEMRGEEVWVQLDTPEKPEPDYDTSSYQW